jgi:hypothetical protein
MKRTERSEFDMQRCPSCDGTQLITSNEAQHLQYGRDDDFVILVFVMPVRRCLSCKLGFTDHIGEKAQTDAIAKYRRLLSPPVPERRSEWAKDNHHMLEHLSPIDVVKAWEEYQDRYIAAVEAGGGIEPPATGV